MDEILNSFEPEEAQGEPDTPEAEEPQKKRPKFALLRKAKTTPRRIMLLAFFLPFFLSSAVYLIAMAFTDGTNMLLSSDGWHQYYPFLVDLRDKLLNGKSLTYSWTVGMGQSYASLYAYYLASPMYLLSVLVPLELLPHYFTLMTIVKLSLAGFCFSWFLRLTYRRCDFALPFFGLMYALCAWASGYYWNIMWLDVFALLPLLIAGMVCLLRDGKFRLYTLTLALSLWCNYYVAFFCCIFVFLSFLGYCLCRPTGWRNFLRRFLRIGLCTLLGVGMACVLLIPTMLAMQTTYSSTPKNFPYLGLNILKDAYGNYSTYDNFFQMLAKETLPGIWNASRQVFSGLLTGTRPTNMSGLPNVFCGMTSVFLSIYYFLCKKISRREKAFNLCLLLFLNLSFILRFLDYYWHGMHFPNMLPYRFSFLFSFVLVAMAYRAYTLLDDFKPRHLAVILPVCALVLVNAWFAVDVLETALVFSALVICGMTLVVCLRRRRNLKRLCVLFLCLIILCEMGICLSRGVDVIGLTSQYDKNGNVVYPRKNGEVQALLNYMEQQDNDLFYRTEFAGTQTLNDASLNGFYGVSIFNSSANANFNRLSRSLGLSSWVGSNRYVYYESSPFTNTLCGIRYLLDRTDGYRNTYYNTLIAESGEVNLFENRSYISLGFMTDRALGEFVAEENKYNPIWEQEEMFRLATGIEDALYDHLTAEEFEVPLDGKIYASGTSGTQYTYTTAASDKEYQSVSIVYTVTDPGLYVATTKKPTDAESNITVYCNDKKLFTIATKVRMLFCVGSFGEGDVIRFEYSLKSDTNGNISLDFAKQNNKVFDAGYALLADEPFVISEFDDTVIRGTVNALSDGLFYTSIPYEPGWTAYVDGKEVTLAAGYDAQNKDVLLTDAVISFPLTAGAHEIELVYTAPGLKLGAVISIVCLLIFVALCVLLRKKPLFPDRPWKKPSPKCNLPLRLVGLALTLALLGDAVWFLTDGGLHGYGETVDKHLIGRLLRGGSYRDDTLFIVLSTLSIFLLAALVWQTVCLVRSRKNDPSRQEETAFTETERTAEAEFSEAEEDGELHG